MEWHIFLFQNSRLAEIKRRQKQLVEELAAEHHGRSRTSPCTSVSRRGFSPRRVARFQRT